jgi:hypothetical protein
MPQLGSLSAPHRSSHVWLSARCARTVREALACEVERTDRMQQTAECALRALDAQVSDGKFSTVVLPPTDAQPGSTFQWMDAHKGINATAVTVPADWAGGLVVVRLHRTPVAPRLPAPSLGAPPPSRPLRNPLHELLQRPLAGVADTRPVNFSDVWKTLFKLAGVRKSDLSDPVKAVHIALALAESWDASAALPYAHSAPQPNHNPTTTQRRARRCG